MSDFEELQKKRAATVNIPSPEGEYRTDIECTDSDGKPYFDGFNFYLRNGHIYYLDNPIIGRTLRMPGGEHYKVVGLETGLQSRYDREPVYVKVVQLREVK